MREKGNGEEGNTWRGKFGIFAVGTMAPQIFSGPAGNWGCFRNAEIMGKIVPLLGNGWERFVTKNVASCASPG
jgi:prolipoprotein diacylglyceryltransferase